MIANNVVLSNYILSVTMIYLYNKNIGTTGRSMSDIIQIINAIDVIQTINSGFIKAQRITEDDLFVSQLQIFLRMYSND